MNDNDNQFFIVLRRKAPLSTALTLWQCVAAKTSPIQRLAVKYIGEMELILEPLLESF